MKMTWAGADSENFLKRKAGGRGLSYFLRLKDTCGICLSLPGYLKNLQECLHLQRLGGRLRGDQTLQGMWPLFQHLPKRCSGWKGLCTEDEEEVGKALTPSLERDGHCVWMVLPLVDGLFGEGDAFFQGEGVDIPVIPACLLTALIYSSCLRLQDTPPLQERRKMEVAVTVSSSLQTGLQQGYQGLPLTSAFGSATVTARQVKNLFK